MGSRANERRTPAAEQRIRRKHGAAVSTSRSADTSPDAERIQIELLRRAGETRRFERVRSLTASVVGLSRRALREQMPGASESDGMIRWVALHHGEALAEGVRRRLAEAG